MKKTTFFLPFETASLCSLDWPWFSCLSLQSTVITGTYHHGWWNKPLTFFLRECLSVYSWLSWNSPRIAGWSWIVRDLPIFASRVIGLEVWTTTFRKNIFYTAAEAELVKRVWRTILETFRERFKNTCPVAQNTSASLSYDISPILPARYIYSSWNYLKKKKKPNPQKTDSCCWDEQPASSAHSPVQVKGADEDVLQHVQWGDLRIYSKRAELRWQEALTFLGKEDKG